MIAKYRTRPVVIEAALFDGSNASANEIFEWSGGGLSCPISMEHPEYTRDHEPQGDGWHLLVTTLEGKMRADAGDFVIRGIKGEFYPCKPDIFAASYEREFPISEVIP